MESEQKPLYITLEKSVLQTYDRNDNNPLVLVRRIENSCLEHTFGDILEKMLCIESDELNPEKYGIEEQNLVDEICGWFAQIYAAPHTKSVTLYAKTNDDPPNTQIVGLTDRVSLYQERIVRSAQEISEHGKPIPYSLLELSIAPVVVGGTFVYKQQPLGSQLNRR